MTTITTHHDLTTLAYRIAADGIRAHDTAVATIAAVARSRGVCRTLAALLEDRSAPAVARERAFGRIAELLAARTDRHDGAPRSRAPVRELVAC
jgi:hypothetical protein